MIITCPNCNKKFKIDPTLIPEDGRNLKCGLCDHVWLYKVMDVSSMPLTLNENIYDDKIEAIEVEKENDNEFNKITEKKEEEKRVKKFIEKQKSISRNKEKNTSSKFFSYLVVFIISSAALIILLDTLKTPLINVFPGLEIILFNLFETLHDIKLFIIDLY
jgi:predicted Zn finger-like uncharacterized protein